MVLYSQVNHYIILFLNSVYDSFRDGWKDTNAYLL